MPEELLHVWDWFSELSRARAVGFGCFQPIAYADLQAWAHLTGSRPTPFEVGLLRRLDDLYLASQSQKKKKGTP